MRFNLFIFAFFALCGHAICQPFTYDIKVDTFRQTENELSVDAFVRIDGEPHTKIRLSTSSESAIRKLFDHKRTTDDLEYSYFRIQTNDKIPAARPMRSIPRLDVITKKVMHELALNEESRRKSVDEPAWDGHLNPFPMKDILIISVSEISQNDFLGIKPKIVIPQKK